MSTWLEYDFVIVGSGIAGLRAAAELGAGTRTLLLTKDAVAESATQYAQGGIAAAMGEDDAVEFHEQDTVAAGDGLCRADAVRVLVAEAPGAIEELLGWGANFDRMGGRLERTREAAHSRSRILHAHGDSTGREIAETLARHVLQTGIQISPHALATRLLSGGGRVAGIEYLDLARGPRVQVRCQAVLLATGGLGQVYAETTNPPVATGDGPALAYAAGAELCDMEFVQFHPTALAFPEAPRFLLSEALRGEGAVLRNGAGERFMPRYHPGAELAPRDQVARAIESELAREGGAGVAGTRASRTCFLDATHMPPPELERRFPRITATLRQYGLDLARDWIPVRPAAHYAMGGVETDLEGRTSLRGLYAAGEAAGTGVHGANRLASNSLLEGLVFGARAGRAMAADAGGATVPVDESGGNDGGKDMGADYSAASERLRRVMWECAGVIRSGESLARAAAEIAGLTQAQPLSRTDAAGCRWHSLATTAAAIVESARARRESRGAHFRTDFPAKDPALDGCHTFLRRGRPPDLGPLPRTNSA